MKKAILILFLLISKISFAQISNGDFEIWDTTYAACYESQLTDTFGVQNPLGGILNRWDGMQCGNVRTTDSYSGNYALILHTWYLHAEGWINHYDSINYRPLFLQGYYKYIKGGIQHNAQGMMVVTLTRYNGMNKDTIAIGTLLFDSIPDYIPFQLTLNYTSALTPDSLSIYIVNADPNSSTGGVVCNLLYLDNLIFSNSALGIQKSIVDEDMFSVYPNPVENELNIQNNSSRPFKFSLFNTLGKRRGLSHGVSRIFYNPLNLFV